MNSKQIADGLIDIALGNGYNEDALLLAYGFPLSMEERFVLMRYQQGKQQGSDYIVLQQIANYIKEYYNE